MSGPPRRARTDARKTLHDVVQLPSGTSLEYVLIEAAALPTSQQPAEAPGERTKLVICLHPWSWLGGRMDDPVLQIVTEPLLERGYDVLRYNSRGVGKSKGWSSLTGGQEAEDLQELVKWARSKYASLSQLVLLGYSHGSLIASTHPVLADVATAHILLSYPLGPRHWLTAFHTHRYEKALQDLVNDPRSNVLIIYGDNDNFTTVESYDAWARGLQDLRPAGGERAARGKLESVKIENASHFWGERDAIRRLVEVLHDWVP
ncbi:alpha/beta-hydrolase [Trametes elegans]|nr:alpha/beta-hydrolase [Trametes elegans]